MQSTSAPAPAAPWIAWHEGLALSHAGDARALPRLRQALQALQAAGDARGSLLGAAALLVTAQVGGSFRDFRGWLSALDPLRAEGPRSALLATADEQLLGLSALLIGQLFFDLQDSSVDAVVDQLVALLEQEADIDLQLAAARLLMYYVEPRELRVLGQRVHALVQQRLAACALAGVVPAPHRQAHWLLAWRTCAGYAKEPQQEEAATHAAQALADRHQLRDVQFALAFDEVNQSLPGGDLPRAERALARAEQWVDAANLRQLMLLDVTRMRLARLRGQVDEVLFRATRARQYAEQLECPGPMMGAYLVNEAHARLLAGDAPGACAQMQAALPLLPEGFALEVREMVDMIEAHEALVRGDPQGRALMAAVWAGLRQRQFYDSFEGQPAFRAQLCVLALEHRIEVDFVTSLIRKCGIAAPPGAPEEWPYALRIRALGQFSVAREGVPLPVEGKGQRKPLELLRVLVAHNATSPATGMHTEALIDMLWPDLEAEAPKASFDMTLMRLRKLLQVDGALPLAEGRLWLEPKLVWTDVAAFEHDFQQLLQLLDAPGNDLALSRAARRLRLRQGHRLFGHGAVEPWITGPQERLSRLLAQAVSAYGGHLEAQGAWLAAVGLYEQGLADDPFNETCTRGLMRCPLALGQPAAAMRAFQRCRDLLAARLQVPPSADTLALRARIPQFPPDPPPEGGRG
ncbi:MAG: bacterial transcriptional activator domain-containing protein [Aquincola sp.]|nr:bacterial transcriptional activator domain-containing protein [Aquincola sp.]